MRRRDFVGGCAALAIQGLKVQGSPQGANFRCRLAQVAHEHPQSVLLSVSRDGKKMCIGEPVQESLMFQMGRWLRKDNVGPGGMLKIVDIGDWTTIYSHQFREKVWPASFFSDGQRLYATTMAFRDGDRLVHQHAIVDLRSKEITDEQQRANHAHGVVFYEAIAGNMLIGGEHNTQTHQTVALVQVELPGYRELARVPFATRSRGPKGIESGVFFSADRTTMAYFCEGVLVCRRTRDLSVVWTRELGSDFKKQWRLALSADGSYVAATRDDSNFFVHPQPSPFIFVYSGRDGNELSRIRSSGTEAIAISPSGTLLAVGEAVREKNGDAVLKVHLRDARSGQELTTLVLDRVKRGQSQFINSGIRIEFTADASYVITSANNSVKAWRMEKQE